MRILEENFPVTKQEDNEDISIPVEVLGTYFKSLLHGPENNTYKNATQDPESEDILDQPIEVRAAIKALKKNKAPGLDGFTPVIFKMFNNQLTSFLTNKLLEQEIYPDSWSTGSIEPIYKKGDKMNPNNYRGITLLPVMGKLFTAIIKDRLLSWADMNSKLNESQFGFRQGRRTTDTIFVLSTAIQSYKEEKATLCLFCQLYQGLRFSEPQFTLD